MNNKNFLFMAFAKGQVATESTEIKRYIGKGIVKVLCMNPTKEQFEKYMGYAPSDGVVTYTGIKDGVNWAKVMFIVRTTPEKSNGIEITSTMSYFVRNQYIKGSQSGKYMVIDNYGNTAWGTEEEIKAKKQIMYANGPANIIGEYSPLYAGQAALVRFLQEYLVIGSPKDNRSGYEYINDTYVPMTGDTLKDCECYFTPQEVQAMFKGDFSAVKNGIELQPTNEIRVLFGINTNKEGKEFQDIYTRPLRLRSEKWDILQEEIEEAKNRGGLQNRTYEFTELKEYKVTPTDFSNTPVADDPFQNASSTEATPW